MFYRRTYYFTVKNKMECKIDWTKEERNPKEFLESSRRKEKKWNWKKREEREKVRKWNKMKWSEMKRTQPNRRGKKRKEMESHSINSINEKRHDVKWSEICVDQKKFRLSENQYEAIQSDNIRGLYHTVYWIFWLTRSVLTVE